MSTTVDGSLSELSLTAESLGKSIASLQEKVQELSQTIGDVADPKSEVQEKEGELELVGGTFAIGAGLHQSLRSDLGEFLDQDEGVSGAGNTEVLALSKIYGSAEKLSTGVEDLKKIVSEKVADIKSLKKVMKSEIDHIIKSIKSDDMDSNLKVVVSVFQQLDNEFDSQINSLQRVLSNNVKPVAKDLEDLLKNNKSFRALAEKLGDTYNTSEGSDRLALAFTNLATLKTTASKVGDVLKSLKMSMEEYKNIKSASDLEKAVTKLLSQSDHKSAILKGIKLLKSTYPNHKEIVKELEKGGGAYSSAAVGRTSRSNHTTLKTRVKTYEDTVKEIFSIFIRQVGVNFSAIKSIFEVLGDSEVVYNESLKNFIAVFENFNSDLENGTVFYALVGLDQTVTGRELKNRFSANLEESILSLNALQGQKLLKDVQTQLLEIKNTINSYSDIMNDTKREESRLKIEGGDLFTHDQTGIVNVSKTIREAILKLKFYGNLVMFKENLSRVSKEYPDLQEGYDQILGKSIGDKLTELQKEYVESVERLNDTERGRGWVLKTYNEKPANSARKIPKGLIENIYKLQYDAKVGLFKTLEAVDLYLMHFTEKVSGDVNALKDLNELLSQTELISSWADDKSIINLQNLGKSMISEEFLLYATALNKNSMVSQTVKYFTDGASIRTALEQCKQSVESIAVLRNIIAMFMKIGDKFSSGSLSKDNYMSSGTMYNNLVRYVWVSAFTMGHGTVGGNASSDTNLSKGKGNYETEKGDKQYFFDLKMTSVTSPLDILRKHESAVKKKLEDLLLNPALNFNIDRANEISSNNSEMIATATLSADIDRDLNTLMLSRTPETKLSLYRLHQSLNGPDIFQMEDKYFVLIMKSIAAKVLTVVGVSNLLNRPSKLTTMIANPVRSIIGANELTVDVEAVELYIRLPLVVEFYKNIFGNGNEDYKKNRYPEDNKETIAFIPEMGSKWSGLIQCIFDDSHQINSGIYSIENMKRIIKEVNHIKKSYTSDQDARSIILDLVNEINRRYGIMRRKDIDDFYQSKKKYSTSGEVSYTNDFDILDPSNSDMDSLGPSSGYVKESFEITTKDKQTSQDDISIVKEFRDLVHKELYSQDLTKLENKSFSERIKYFKQQVSMAKSDNDKVEVIIKAIDDSSDVSNFNTDILAVYHELVKFPLAVLSRMYKYNLSAISRIVLSRYFNGLTDSGMAVVSFVRSINLSESPTNNKTTLTKEEFIRKMNELVIDSANDPYYDSINRLREFFRTKSDKDGLQYSKKTNTDKLIARVKETIAAFKTAGIDDIKNYPTSLKIEKDGDSNELKEAYAKLSTIFINNDADAPGLGKLEDKHLSVLYDSILSEKSEAAEYKYLIEIIKNYRPAGKGIDNKLIEELLPHVNATGYNMDKAKATLNKLVGKLEENVATAVKKGIKAVKFLNDELVNEINKIKKDDDLSQDKIKSFHELLIKYNQSLNAGRTWRNFTARRIKARNETDMFEKQQELFGNVFAKIAGVDTNSVKAEDFTKVNLTIIRQALGELGITELNEMLDSLLITGNVDDFKVFFNALAGYVKLNKASATTFVIQNFKSKSINLKYMANSKIVLDYSKLQKEVESAIQLAKYASSKYRHLIPASINTQTDKDISDLEHSYLFKMIYNQDTDKDPILSNFNFEKCNTSLNILFESFNKKEIEKNEGEGIKVLTYLYESICGIDYSNLVGIGSKEMDNDKTLMKTAMLETFKSYDETKKQWSAYNYDTGKIPELSIIQSMYSTENSMKDDSVLLKFNNLIVRYIDTFFEESTKKFYAPLVSELCKSQSSCVYSGQGLKDMLNKGEDGNKYVNNLTYSDNDSVLSESIGYMLKVLTTRDLVKQLDKKFYALSNINDVSVNMVDKFHTYLPVFIHMFSKIIDDCIIYKRMLELMPAEFVNKAYGDKPERLIADGTVIMGDVTTEIYNLGGRLVSGSNDSYGHMNNTLGNLIEACRSIIQSAKNVLMEVDYNPKHLEIKQNFVKNFEENFKNIPTTPVSAIMVPVDRLPSSKARVNDYKMTRGLNYISSDSQLDFPWLKKLLSDIRNSTTGENSADTDRVMAGINDVVKLSHNLVDYYFYNKIGLVDLQTISTNPVTTISTFYNASDVNQAVALTENSSVESSKKLLAVSMDANSTKKDILDRPTARLLNLIDMNINPINHHALMREIPLINIYNYAFTFDDIVSKDFGVDSSKLYDNNFMCDKFSQDKSGEIERKALASLLLDPYYNVDRALKVIDKVTDSAIRPETVGLLTNETLLRRALTNPIVVNDNLKLGVGKYVKEIGSELRSVEFNTKFVRNLVFMTNLQRYLLSKIKNEVHRVNSRRVKSTDILSDRIVSYEDSNGTLSSKEFDLFEL